MSSCETTVSCCAGLLGTESIKASIKFSFFWCSDNKLLDTLFLTFKALLTSFKSISLCLRLAVVCLSCSRYGSFSSVLARLSSVLARWPDCSKWLYRSFNFCWSVGPFLDEVLQVSPWLCAWSGYRVFTLAWYWNLRLFLMYW